MLKKPLSLILALLMILSAFAASPLTVFAEDTAAETDAHEGITDLKTGDRSADRDIASVGSDLIDLDNPDYEYVLLDDGTAKITFFQTMFMPSEIRVPEALGGHQVTETGTLIFRFYDEIKKIILPKGLKTIGRYTSSGCTNLTEVVIPDTVTSIGEGAFYGSPKLTSVDIPASVTEIGPLAFGYYWDNLTETDVKVSGFTVCGKKGTAAEKYAKDNDFSFFDINDQTVYSKSSKLKLAPDGTLTASGSGPMPGTAKLDHAKIKSAVIEDGITSIGQGAFSLCKNLKSVTIGKDVSSIGYGAFSGCDALETVNITDVGAWCGISFSYYFSNPIIYTKSIFLNGSLLKKMTVPDSVAAINNYAFESCKCLEEITVGKYTSIGKEAFTYCDKLTQLNYTDASDAFKKPVTIGEKAFIGCTNLKIFNIPDSVTSIGDHAFESCKNLTAIDIPNSVTSLGVGVFIDCEKIKSVTLSENISEVSDSLFGNCKNLTKNDIPDSVTRIGYGAFQGCMYMDIINIPDSVTSVGSGAFSGTGWLYFKPNGIVYAGKVAYTYKGDVSPSEIVLKDGTLGIAEGAFTGSKNLTKVTIPDTVVEIGSNAFEYCDSLKSVTIPRSVKRIGDYAFRSPFDNPSDYIIRGYRGTAAEKYAEENGFTFIALDDAAGVTGDVTGDGKTNVQDCTAILRYVRKLDTNLSDYQLKCADVTGDGKVNVQDVTRILRHVRKIEALY